MTKFILGKKIGMTQVFDDQGRVQPVTLVHAEPNSVTQIKTHEKEGYNAVQMGVGKKKLNNPEYGHVKNLTDDKKRGPAVLREVRIKDGSEFNPNDTLSVEQFSTGEQVTITGTTKGKGFQGVVKRWGFSGGPKTHGTKDTHRTSGSIGGMFPQRVTKGLKMAGHQGVKRKSVVNAKVVFINKDQNIIGIKGAVPGKKGGFVEIRERNGGENTNNKGGDN